MTNVMFRVSKRFVAVLPDDEHAVTLSKILKTSHILRGTVIKIDGEQLFHIATSGHAAHVMAECSCCGVSICVTCVKQDGFIPTCYEKKK